MQDQDSDVESDLTPTQERAIGALLQEVTIVAAAAACGVPQGTLQRWLREPAFKEAFRKTRRDVFGTAVAMTQRCAPMAVQVLANMMMDRGAPHGARISAAATLLRLAREGIEVEDLADRVEMLETAAKAAKGVLP